MSQPTDPHVLLDATSGVAWVRLLWSDAAGLRRCRVIPRKRVKKVAESGLGLVEGCQSLQAWGDIPAPASGLSSVGEVRLVPDMATLRRLPWHPAHGVVLASMLRQPPPPDHAGDTEHLRWECCPRSALQRALAAARERHGVRFRVSFEVEFVLLRGRDPGQGDGTPRPIDAALYCQTSALDAAAPVLDDITDALAKLGIEVEQVHKESAGGQFEIVTEHEEVLKAVDNLLLTREAISCVAARAGLSTSFLPKLGPSEAGSGAHCHISLFNGLEHGWTLPEPCNIDPVDLPGAARLPTSLAEAIRAFEAAPEASWAAYIARAAQLAPGGASGGGAGLPEVLKRDLGPALVTSFMAVRRAEEEHFRDCSPEELVEQLLTRY